MSDSCFFSMQVDVDDNTVYRDSLDEDDIECDQKISAFKRELEAEYKGTITDFFYGDGLGGVIAKEEDITEGMTFQKLYDDHGQQEDGAFYVKITTKKVSPAKLAIMNQIKELRKKVDVLMIQISTLETKLRSTGGKGGKTRKRRKMI